MPDTFTHAILGLTASILLNRDPSTYIIAVLLSELPDIDAFTPQHRAACHSLLVVSPLTLVLLLSFNYTGLNSTTSAVLALLPLLHVVMDFTCGGLPVRLLWPLSNKGVQLADKIDIIAERLLSISPYGYYKEVIRANLVLFICILALLTLTLLPSL